MLRNQPRVAMEVCMSFYIHTVTRMPAASSGVVVAIVFFMSQLGQRERAGSLVGGLAGKNQFIRNGTGASEMRRNSRKRLKTKPQAPENDMKKSSFLVKQFARMFILLKWK